MRTYSGLDDAIEDILQLAEAMTYRNALSGINFGGGTSALITNNVSSEVTRDELFLGYGRFLKRLAGRYIAAEDMGTTVADMGVVFQVCESVAGKDPKFGGGGDPIPLTAKGVVRGMQACLKRLSGSSKLEGRTVAIEGLGRVGVAIGRLLKSEGVELLVTDILPDVAEKAAEELGATVVPLEKFPDCACDIYAPCGIGGTINPETVRRLRCRIVAGCANNQIAGFRTEASLIEKGILYAPDFVINAGGVILCADEGEPGGFSQSRVEKRVDGIYDVVINILEEAEKQDALPGAVAVDIARDRIEKAKLGEHF
jgi:leucine dehydrogenase